jgi:3-deoxy-manno-octulosonate cytidylyltransferase (CMP-KDO synthetase)
MSFTVIIPARFASTRLPGKPLLLIDGKPMVQHVYEQALKSNAKKVIVATDDQRIFDAVKVFGGEVCMTAPDHLSGTDRIQEVVQQYQLGDDEIVVNVQGDEPRIPPEVIQQVANNLANNQQASAATLSEAITDANDVTNPNVVKVVADNNNIALYFSRASIPFPRDTSAEMMLADDTMYPQRHIGIYAYRVSLLHRFITWAPAPIERLESLEQLRILFYGERIHVESACQAVPGGVDTAEDLERIQQCQ